MGIRKYKPTTPGRRGASVADFAEITRSTPEKSLLRPLSKTGGRNNSGRITTRHKGGGHKRQYRVIDFRRHDKDGIPARVAHIEYDPNRTARIALLHYVDGEKRYIWLRSAKQGMMVENGPNPPTSSLVTTFHFATFQLVQSSTLWNCVQVVELRSPARQAFLCSSLLRKASTPSYACLLAKFVMSTRAAVRLLAKLAMQSSPTSTGVKQAVCAGRASVQPSAVLL